MKRHSFVITSLIIPMLISSVWLISDSEGVIESREASIVSELPDYEGGYGFDPQTGVMEDTNGFRYSYQPDGIVKLKLPWGYTTHFSFGLTAEYLDVPEQRTALDYSWTWDTIVSVELNETGNLTGYAYSFVATSESGVLDWEIRFDFSPTTRMKVTHTLTNRYAQALTDVNFWYLFDLRGTTTPYTIETYAGIVEGPLYQAIPDNIHWVRLGNQFQFDWRDALIDYENGHAYIGDGAIVGLDGLPILGISIELGNIASSTTVTIDPYFSGVALTWDANSDGLASSPSNWSPVQAPDTGDNITFDGTSVFNCDWDVEVTLGNFFMLTGYTGTVTQYIDFGIHDFLIEEGVFEGNPLFWITTSGNTTKTGGTVTTSRCNFNMTGTNVFFSLASTILGLRINDSATVTNTISTTISTYGTGTVPPMGQLIVRPNAILTLDSVIAVRYYAGNVVYTNFGLIDGSSKMVFNMYSGDREIVFGNVSCEVDIAALSLALDDRILTLGANTVLEGGLNVYSSHDEYTLTIDSSDYTFSVSGAISIGANTTLTQGTGAWSVGSYLQDGVSSVFNQGATLTIGGDFTVSDGIFNAVGNMTVPGDWDTATGDYVNDDNVVTLTGASKTLAMHADDSFFNVTVSGSYTMNTDTTVRLRATITGTVDGTGDFLEPLPEFTSIGWPYGCPGELYEYTPTQTYWDTLAIYDAPYWLFLVDGVITGVPNDNDTGVHLISLTLIWNDMVTYQNYTIIVCPELLSSADRTMLGVGLSIVLGFGLLTIGLTRDMSYLIVFAGFVWMVSSVTIYKDINLVWTIITFGIGAMILAEGGLRIVENSEL